MTASRVGLTIGSTTRLNEFDFAKISLSLERDLVPAENPVDAYRDIKALLERMISEFQGPKAVARVQQEPKTQQTGNGTPRVETPKPAGLTVDTVRERTAKWLPDLEIVLGFDGFNVRPKRFLDQSWSEVNEVVRSLGGKWQKGLKSTDGAWRIPK
jgi:hypothetical protein